MPSSSETIETTIKSDSEVRIKEGVIEAIQEHIDKNFEAIAAQQSKKLIKEIQGPQSSINLT